MEPKQCNMINCTKKAELQCNCTTFKTFMCQTHMNDHRSIKGRYHNIQWTAIDPEMEEFALSLLYEEKSKISQSKIESINIFYQLFFSLENLLRKLCQVHDMNLSFVEQNITKIKVTKDFSNFETDQLLRSLLSKDDAKVLEMCLIDEKIFTSIKAINKYVNEIHEMIRKLNINNLEDVARNNIEGFIGPFVRESLKDEDQQSMLTHELKKWEHTIMSLNQDIKNYPTTRESYYFKWGIIKYLAGKAHSALSLFNFAIKLNPNYSDCYFYKGLALISLHRKEDALECWNYLTENNKNFSFINLIKARVLISVKRSAESIELYDEFIKNSPQHFLAYDLQIDSLYDEKRYRQINVYCDEMLISYPKFSPAYFHKGYAFKGLNDCEKALENFFKAIENDENCYSGYDGIGEIFYNQDNYEDSLAYFNRAVAINPYRGTNYTHKGWSLYKLDRMDEAFDCFTEAISLDPKNSNNYNNIGRILFRRKEYKKAIKYYDKAIKIDPSNKTFQNNKNDALLMITEDQ